MSSTVQPSKPVDNSAGKKDDDSSDEMPPLEDIHQEMSELPENNKNIKGLPGDSDEELEAEENGWVDILSNGDLRMKRIVPSPKDNPIRPQSGTKCRIRIHTRLYDPTVSSEDDNGAIGEIIEGECDADRAIVIGDTDIHQSIDLMLPLMEEGATYRLVVKPRFAYGPIGNMETGVPPNSTLDIELELLEIIEHEMPPVDDTGDSSGDANPIVFYEPLSDRLELGERKKKRGNFWYQRGEFSLAIQCYRGAIKFLDVSREEMKSIDEYNNGPMSGDLPETVREDYRQVETIIQERSQTFNNLAAAQLKMQAFDSALLSVEACLLLSPKNVKALFRRAKILAEKGEIEKAICDLKLANSIDPSSESIELELSRLNSKLTRQNQEQRAMYRRMMKIDSETDSNSNSDKNDSSHKKDCKNSSPEKSSGSSAASSCLLSSSGGSCAILKGAGKIFTRKITIVAVVAALFAGIIPLFYSYFK